MNGWLSVEETARICGTDVQRITLWMNSNHIAFARFDTVLMTDSTSLFALFERNRVDTIYDDMQTKKGRGSPGKHRRLKDTPLEDLLFLLIRFRFDGLYCVRNFGSQAANEVLLRLRRDGLIDGGGRRDFKVLHL